MRRAYLARIVGDVKLTRKLRVAVDCGNGVAGELAPELLRRLGCEVQELYCDIDGTFPNHHPDPAHPENLQDLIAAVKKTSSTSVSPSTATATASASSRRTATSSGPTAS